MSLFICPICGNTLYPGEKIYHCSSGHSFDVARQKYINLLPVQQKKSLHPGDTKEMVEARYNFLSAGFYLPVLNKVCFEAEKVLIPGMNVLDAGCGEGYYLSGLEQRFGEKLNCYGIDISKDAVRFATRRSRKISWITATSAHIPFKDGVFDLLISMFAPVEGK